MGSEMCIRDRACDLSDVPEIGKLDVMLENYPGAREEMHGTLGPVCIKYDLEGYQTPRWACAILPVNQQYFYYAGFDHAEGHEAIEHLECEEESLEITAAQVEASQREEDLRKFVRQAMDAAGDALSEAGLSQALKKMQCIADAREGRGSPWRSDSVYCLLYTSPSPRDRTRSRMPSSA